MAFRGTLPPSTTDPDSWLDWLQNFFAPPISNPSGPNKVPGQVHRGFYNATASIIGQVHDLVMRRNPGPDNPLFITGHGKGGALASIAAYILSQNLGVPAVQHVVTIASPMPGDGAFRTGFELVLRQTRYENDGDLVPLLPSYLDFISNMTGNPLLSTTEAGSRLPHLLQSAQQWHYVPIGSMLFVTSDFRVIGNEDRTAQKLNVAKEFSLDFMTTNFSSIVNAHSLLPDKGYNKGVCGGGQP